LQRLLRRLLVAVLGTDCRRRGKPKETNGTPRATEDLGICGPWKGSENGSLEESIMIPSLEELRKRLVPAHAPDSASNSFKGSPQISATPTGSDPSSPPEFLVLRQNLPKFGPSSRIVCRLCRRPPECSVILRPKHLKPRPSEINRSSLAGWLKHDFVFFGESYLCEGCAKAEGFI